MKTSFKRAAAWLLTVLMILSCVPALATGDVTEYSAEEGINLLSDVSTYATNVQVKFNKNGGSGTAPSTITCAKGETITLPSGSSLSKSGYTFAGWGLDPNSGGAGTTNLVKPIYPVGSEYIVNGNVTLYAIWGQNNQTAEFFIRLDGTIPNEPNGDDATGKAYYTGDGTGSPGKGMGIEDAVKYDAFYFNAKGVDDRLNAKPTVKSIWTACENALKANKTLKFSDGSLYTTCTQETFEANYYVLWYVIKHPDGLHVDGVLLKKSLFNVTYNPNAPIGEYEGQVPNGRQYADGVTVTVTSNVLTRTGYTFGGWATSDVNGEDQIYKGGDTFQMPAKNVELTAIWIPNSATPYKVEYYYSTSENGNGDPIYADSCDSYVSRTGTTGAQVEVTEADKKPQKNGYVLDDGAEGRLYEGQIAADGSLVLKVYFKYTGGDKKTIGVQKEWVGPETDSVTIRLTRNSVTSTVDADKITLSKNNNWYGEFSNLPTYDRDGNVIDYGVTEDTVAGYDATITGPVTDSSGVLVYTVTNSYIRQKISISVTKVWDDSSNVTGARPASLEVKLIGKVAGKDVVADENGQEISSEISYQTEVEKTATLTVSNAVEDEPNKWVYTFSGDDITDYDACGNEIIYFVEETVPDGYTLSSSSGNATDGFTLTNTLNTQTVKVTKYIAGNMGDQSKLFAFTVTATGVNNQAVPIMNGETEVPNGIYTVNLSHSDSSALLTIPYGAKVTISETVDANYNQRWAEGEDTAFADTPFSKPSYVITSLEEDKFVKCENSKNVVPDTGVVLDSLPYIVILAIVLLGVVLMVRKRHRDDD